MSPSSAERAGTARVAVVGAPTHEGALLRHALAEFGVPGSRVELYGVTDGEAVISEYAGEARLVQEPDLPNIASSDAIFLCEAGATTLSVADTVGADTAVIDMLGALDSRRRLPRVHLEIRPERLRGNGHRWFAAPQPLALLLAELLWPLDRLHGVEEVSAVVLRPASDFGERGVEELREQTVRLLNSGEAPKAVFGRQLAFNVLPDDAVARAVLDRGEHIAADVDELLGWERGRTAVQMLAAPMFYGHGLLLRVRTPHHLDPAAIHVALREAGCDVPGNSSGPLTPLEVAGEVRASLAGMSSDDFGGHWMWIVAGETAARGARHAVRLASRLCEL